MTNQYQHDAHVGHCAQGEYEGVCKYGNENCLVVEHAEASAFREARLEHDAFQLEDNWFFIHGYKGNKGELGLVMNVNHRGGKHDAIVTYEIIRDGAVVDSGSLVEMVSVFNTLLVMMKLS